MAVSVASGSDDDYARSSSSNKPSSISIDPETIRLQFSSLVARLLSRVSMETLRPLPVFLGVNPVGFCLSVGAFTPPVKKMDKGTPEKIRSRLRLNCAFFLTNYILLASMVALVVALMHPGMLLFLGAVWSLWSLHSFMIRHELILFGLHLHSLLTVQQRFYGLFFVTTIVVVWKCLVPTLIFCAISSFLILTHAFLRDPKHIEQSSSSGSLRSADSDDDDEEEGDSGDSAESEVLVERPKRGDVI
jgi:PRA1 family protein